MSGSDRTKHSSWIISPSSCFMSSDSVLRVLGVLVVLGVLWFFGGLGFFWRFWGVLGFFGGFGGFGGLSPVAACGWLRCCWPACSCGGSPSDTRPSWGATRPPMFWRTWTQTPSTMSRSRPSTLTSQRARTWWAASAHVSRARGAATSSNQLPERVARMF